MALDARACAARIVGQVLKGKSLNEALPALLPKVAEREQALVQQLCYGTLRAQPLLTAVLDQLLDKPLRAKDSDIKALLLIGLYQLQDMRIPDHAAVATTVDATKTMGKPWAKGLANALLRRYLREHEQLLDALEPSEKCSHPPWMYRAIHNQWPDEAEQIIQANNNQPPMSLRVNTRQCSREDYLQKLSLAGIAASPGSLGKACIRLQKPVDVAILPGFFQGEVSVQDEAAQMAAQVLGAQAGERVLDACSAPGSKACHILELQSELKELVAADLDSQRLEKVRQDLQRLSLTATTAVVDASEGDRIWETNSFDRILVDAPCSASGVIRRHPDVKLLRRQQDVATFAQTQLQILKGLWPLLKVGGTLLYATCSIFEEENSQVVEKFLRQTRHSRFIKPEVSWGKPCAYGRQLLPTDNGNDGLFYALIKKV